MRHLVCVSAESADPGSPSWTSEASAGRWLIGGPQIIAAHAENGVRFSGMVVLTSTVGCAILLPICEARGIADAFASEEEIRNGRISCQDRDGSG